jgi:DNA polymerase elongation subunit (family B)
MFLSPSSSTPLAAPLPLVPRRRRVPASDLRTSEHLVFFLQQTEVIPFEELCGGGGEEEEEEEVVEVEVGEGWRTRKRKRGGGGRESRRGREDGGDEGDEEDEGDEPALSFHRPIVVMSGVTSEGVSVALRVDGWSIPIYLMPSPRLAACDPSSNILFRFAEEFLQHHSSGHKLDIVFAPRAYGYCPDPSNPAQRAKVGFVRVRFSDMKQMRWALRALSEAIEDGTAAAANPAFQLPRTATGSLRANYQVVRGNATIEEGERLKPEFKFLDEREIPPSTWVVVSRTRWALAPEAFSYRTVNATCDQPNAIWSLANLMDDGKMQEILNRGVRPGTLPRVDSVPPSLLAYCDIESKSHDRNEFPDPSHPDAPCYMVGISLVWTFAVPPSLVNNTTSLVTTAAEGSTAEGSTAAAAAAEAAAAERVLRDRRARIARRRERVARYEAKNEDFKRILHSVLGCEDLRQMNSDDESEGEERAVRAAVDAVRKEAEVRAAHRQQVMRGALWQESNEAGSVVPVVANHPFMRILLVLGETDPIPDAITITLKSEKELLLAVREVLFEIMDVDGIRGYNWLGFDTRYLVRRAELHNVASTALRWSHLVHRPPKYDRTEVSLTLQRGLFRMIRMHFTNTVDIMVYMRQQLDLASYKLEAVAQNFGLEGKHPVTPDDIFVAGSSEGTSAQRGRVGAYCLRDCDVLVDIARASQFEITILQFARIMLTPCELMWTSGQQIRVIHQLIWQAHRSGFVVDGLWRQQADKALRVLDSGKNFSGGFVMKPVVGHHRTPTATLDYKSLYPSIMISHKLCYSTALLHPYDSDEWVRRIEATGLEVIRIRTESGNFAFVQHPINLIPDMEWKLWVSRQTIKKEMKGARAIDPLLYSALDAKQLAVKVSMNSTFGVTGAEHAFLGMKRIAAAITHVGRTTVQAAREFADSIAAKDLPEAAPGVAILQDTAKLRTVYGDTDSIMVNLPDALTPQFVSWAAERLGAGGGAGGAGSREAAAAAGGLRAGILLLACRIMGDFITSKLNERYRKPMEIEFEEVASEAIFLKPKMYTKNVIEDVSDASAAKLARGERVGKLKVAGIAAKRRDRSALTKRLQKAVATSIIQRGDDERALQLVRRWVARLVLYEIEVDDFLITTELKNPMERVGQAVQPWVAVAWAMEHACKGSEPIRGERVPWLIVRQADKTRTVPPETKRAGSKDVHIESHVPIATTEDLIQALHADFRNPKLNFVFGTILLNALPPATLLVDIGLQPGHKLVAQEEGSSQEAFRVHWEHSAGSDAEHSGGEEQEAQEGEEGQEGCAKQQEGCAKQRGRAGETSALQKLMFRARELSSVERRNLGKKRVESDSLSPFARHPSEIKSIREVDVENYLKHIVQALSILLQEPRPDLWDQIDRTIKRARPLIAYSQGKPIQRSLMGFMKKE